MSAELDRVAELEAELRASRKVIDALIRRAERRIDSLAHGPDQFAVIKALSGLEGIIAERTRELHQSEARYRALYDHSPDMLFTVDPESRITAVNQTALEAFDCEEDALVGCLLASLFDDDAQQQLETWVKSGFRGLAEEELALDDGRVVSVNAAPVPGLSGQVQVVFRDVTTRRRLEAELGHARRLAAIGHLAAGVAHEINNPLTVMQLRLELLEEELSGPARDQVHMVAEHTNRIARIVRNLQSFAHPRSEERAVVSLGEIVASALEVAAPHLGQVTARVELEPDLALLADRGRAEQVLVNLLANAGDAQQGKGWVRVRGRREEGKVRIVVEDSGPGIPDELLDHVFTPFVSGKGLRGSGLGLAIAWSIVKEHGGTITCGNRPQGGARFELTFPAADHRGEVARSSPVVVASPSRPMRLLVIDDERPLLQLIAEFAGSMGHHVVAVDSAEEALEQLGKDEDFDAIVSDIRLPGMSGRDLLGLLRSDRPELARRTVLMSGFFHRPGGDVPYLQKPFGRREFLAALELVAPTPPTLAPAPAPTAYGGPDRRTR